jgi:LPXTG-motif cell wall-anchored protein
MTDKTDSSAKPDSNDDKSGWSSTAIAGAAIGSAALAAALLFVSRRREKSAPVAAHPEDAPETD